MIDDPQEWPEDFNRAVEMSHDHLIARMKEHLDEYKAHGGGGVEAVAEFMATETSDVIFAAFSMGVLWRDAHLGTPIVWRQDP